MKRIIIEKELLENNINIIKAKLKRNIEEGKNIPQIIAVLKANAYGMGAIQFARVLLENEIDFFAVADVDEAIELRNAGFTNKILVLNATSINEEIEKIVDYDLIATVGSITAIKSLNEIASAKNKMAQCHLKIDTGFCRFGFRYEEIENNKQSIQTLKEIISQVSNLEIVGAYSHFQESYANDIKATKEQFNRFMNCVNILKEEGINTGLLHICNSSAFFQYEDMYLDAIRIGSAFTGRIPIGNRTGLKKVGYLESEICEIKNVKKGNKVGYSGICKLGRDSMIAIVEAGYCHGVEVTRWDDKVRLVDKLRLLKTDFMRLFKDENRFVKISNKPYKILGRIAMNNFIIDITDSEVKVGDKVKIDIHLVYANSKIERKYL